GLATLTTKLESQLCARNLDVPITHGGQTKRAVFLGIGLIADANQRGFEKSYHDGEHLLARQARLCHISFDASANARERFAKRDHTVVFGGIPHLAPTCMIAVLLAVLAVAPRG